MGFFEKFAQLVTSLPVSDGMVAYRQAVPVLKGYLRITRPIERKMSTNRV